MKNILKNCILYRCVLNIKIHLYNKIIIDEIILQLKECVIYKFISSIFY